MKVIVSRIIPYDDMPTDKMHVHVLFAEEQVKYHRTCEVVVFLDKGDSRPLPVLKEEAVRRAYDFLAEIVALRDFRQNGDYGEISEDHRRQ